MIAPEMPSEPGTTSTSTIDIVPVQEAFSLFTRRSPTTDRPRIQAKSALDLEARVYGQGDPGDEAGRIRREELYGVGDVLHLQPRNRQGVDPHESRVGLGGVVSGRSLEFRHEGPEDGVVVD